MRMVTSIKANGLMIRRMEWAHLLTFMEQSILASGQMTHSMVTEKSSGTMDKQSISDNSTKARKMEKAGSNGTMAASMREILWMAFSKDMVFFIVNFYA
jgi:hypothetical protein